VKTFRIIFIAIGLLAFTGGLLGATHQFALALICAIVVITIAVQEENDRKNDATRH